MRAEPASHAEPIPAIEKLRSNANGATIQAAFDSGGHVPTACTMPCRTLMSFLLTAIRSVSVAPIYSKSGENAAPGYRAGENFLRILDFVAHD